MRRYVVGLSGVRRFGTGLLHSDAMSLGYVDSDVSGQVFWDVTLCRSVKRIPTFRDWSSGMWRYDTGWVDSDVSGLVFCTLTPCWDTWIPTFRVVFWDVTLCRWVKRIPTFRDWSSGMWRWHWVSGFWRFGTGILHSDAMSLGYVNSDVSGRVFWDEMLCRWVKWIPTFRHWSSGTLRYVVGIRGFRRFETGPLGYDAMTLGEWIPTFRRNIVPLSSTFKRSEKTD
jgi:hypothetical protein